MANTSLQTIPLLDPEHDPGTEQAHTTTSSMSGETMKAVHYEGPFKVSVKEVELPKIVHPDDVIVKVTTAAICGSDLHMYQGRTAAESGLVFGHENMGIVIETGSGVTLLEKGDRIVLPFNVADGRCQYAIDLRRASDVLTGCRNCEEGRTAFCTG
jgi:threonine dehydrogenase-like Zn-dependent dehydrogenase